MPALALLTAVLFANPTAESDVSEKKHSERKVPVTSYRTAGWSIHRTQNFRICSRRFDEKHRQLAERCELLRNQLQDLWFDEQESAKWTPRCDVIVHASLGDYQRSLGAGVGRSVACTTIKVDEERVVVRRIDIRTDADNWRHDALPHELTHVVVADRFAGRKLPTWANEGMAVLAESKAKRHKRLTAFKQSRTTGPGHSVHHILRQTGVAGSGNVNSFYFRSATLVEFLVRRRTSAEFIEFLETAHEHDYDHALREIYEIDGTMHLARLWRPHDGFAESTVSVGVVGTQEK